MKLEIKKGDKVEIKDLGINLMTHNSIILGLLCVDTKTSVKNLKNEIMETLDFIADMKSDDKDAYSEEVLDMITDITDTLEGLESVLEEEEDSTIVNIEVPSVVTDVSKFNKKCWRKLENLLNGYYNNRFTTEDLKLGFKVFQNTMNRSYDNIFHVKGNYVSFKIAKETFISCYLTLKDGMDSFEENFGTLGEIFKPMRADFFKNPNDELELIISEKEIMKLVKSNLWVQATLERKGEFTNYYIWNDINVVAEFIKYHEENTDFISISEINKKPILDYDYRTNKFSCTDKKYKSIPIIYNHLKKPFHLNGNVFM